MDVELLLQRLIDGISSGAIYASLALAVVIVYRTTGVVNFAQGEMAMATTFVAWALHDAGVPAWPAVVAGMVVGFLLGAAIERVVIRRVGDAEGNPLGLVIATIGLAITLNGLVQWRWGAEGRSFPRLFPQGSFEPMERVAISYDKIGVLLTMLVLVGLLFLLLQRTKVGLAMRAVASTTESSALVGVPVSRMLMIGWGLAGAIGALAGAMWASGLAGFDTNLMQLVLVYAFAAAVVGGFDSPVGAIVGGLVVGLAENLVSGYVDAIGTQLTTGIALGLLLLVLLVRPRGLFGRVRVVRV